MRELSCGSEALGVVSVPITMYGHASKTIHAYTGLLIWIGHAPFHKHKRSRGLWAGVLSGTKCSTKVCWKGCENGPELLNRASVY